MVRRNRGSRAQISRFETGFSLVELMVAMALSLVLLAGVLAIFSSSRTTYETTDRLSRIQESGRFALDTIVRDLRSAGYLGCSRRATFTNALNTPTGVLMNYQFPIQGFNASGASWLPAIDTTAIPNAAADSDILVARVPRGQIEPVRVVAGTFMSSPTDTLRIADVTPALIKAGDVVEVSDCTARAVFQVTKNTAGVLEHAALAAAADLPGNADGSIGWAFTDAAELVPMQSVVYYLRASSDAASGTSLWRRVSGAGGAEELVEGVENMQVTFGVANGALIDYRTADNVGATNWGAVRTVRIALLIRSLSEYGTNVPQQGYDLLGKNIAAKTDRHLRQVFTTTVNVRNLRS